MKPAVLGLFAACLLPGAAFGDDVVPTTDIFSYSTLEADHWHMHSDYFGDSSSGNGLKFSYDFPDEVYLFGQWDKLNFDSLKGGSHTLEGVGVGAHQAYNPNLSFYIDLAFLRDKLSGFSDASDNYWRVSYGFRGKANSVLEIDGAIFTERNTVFGRRSFGERLGFGLDFSVFSLLTAVEHTADGNRTELTLMWAYR